MDDELTKMQSVCEKIAHNDQKVFFSAFQVHAQIAKNDDEDSFCTVLRRM